MVTLKTLLRRRVGPAGTLIATALFIALSPSVGSAQGLSGAIGLFIDPSVRSSGMGRSAVGVFWGDDPNSWANPALLGYHHGVRFERGRTRLVPDVANSVFFTTRQLTLGAWGVGVRLAGKPIDGLGDLTLDYGRSQATNPGDPTPIGSFHSYEDISAFGVGLSAASFIDAAAQALGGADPGIRRSADFAVGWTTKTDDVVFLEGGPPEYPTARGSTSTEDLGILARLTPLNSIGTPGRLPALDRLLHPVADGVRLDFAYGESRINRDGGTIALISFDDPDPVSKQYRHGLSMRVAVGWPGIISDLAENRTARTVLQALTPFVSFGKAWDRVQDETRQPDTGELVVGRTVRYEGHEVTIANLYTIRRGRVEDIDGGIMGRTKGWGASLRLGDVASIRYDEATVPQYVELARVHRKSYSLSLNALALRDLLRGRPLPNEHY